MPLDSRAGASLDFAWPEQKVAVEIEGGVFSGGRHTRGAGFVADCDKYNALAAAGWRLFRFTEKHLAKRPVQCCELVAAALASEGLAERGAG
jgi:very-short-patch-repair endonuclease